MNYLNTRDSFDTFMQAVASNIYVDKSMMIEEIMKRTGSYDKYICITRPRRFGKSTNAGMLAAYFTKGYDSGPVFENLSIHDSSVYGKKQNQCNVIHIDFSRRPDLCRNYEDYIMSIIRALKEDLLEAYPFLSGKNYDRVADMLRDTKESFVFILDEWDAVFYEKFMTEDDKELFLKWLKGILKDQAYVELAYMTGVLPVRKYSSGSELNMFDEYNFMNDNVFDIYFGFTEGEVKELCKKHTAVSYEELRTWYDGYHLFKGGRLFNPRSVNKALTRGICLNYWTETGPMNEIAECIEHNVDEVREDIVKLVAGIPIRIRLDGYSVSELNLDTRDEILSAMVVYGFLDYYDGMLSIPNGELMEKFQKVLERDSMGEVKAVVERSREMTEATLLQDEDRVAAILEEVHDREIPFLQYNDENALSCVVTLCYLYARDDYRIEREEKSGKGYCDYLFYPRHKKDPAIILELKVGGSCEEAIEQIKQKNYMQKVEHCRKVLLVGINYGKDKKHSCRIEAIEK